MYQFVNYLGVNIQKEKNHIHLLGQFHNEMAAY